MSSDDRRKTMDRKEKRISFERPQMNDWHTDPYPCTVPRCIEVVKLVGQFMDLPTDYKVPNETMYGFYAIVIEELKAQHEAIAVDSEEIKQKLSDMFKEWQNKGESPMDAEIAKAVAKMKIFMVAWTKTVDEIEKLKSANEPLQKAPKTPKLAKVKK